MLFLIFNFNIMQEQNKQTEQDLLSLADNMAAAAASFSSHGYDSFICAREMLKQAIHSIVSRVKT